MCRGEKEWGSVWSKCYLEIIFIYILFKNAVFLHLKKSTFYLWSSIDCSQKVFVNNRRSWDVKKLQKALANVWTFHGCFLKKEIIKIITTNKMFLIFYFIVLFCLFVSEGLWWSSRMSRWRDQGHSWSEHPWPRLCTGKPAGHLYKHPFLHTVDT